MSKFTSLFVVLALLTSAGMAQTQQKPPQEPDDIIRISTALVQTDAVVVDKNDRVVTDLKLEDFEVYENGKKQDIKFMEFVSIDTGRRSEGDRPAGLPSMAELPRELTAGELKRVIAFVIDDLTIPFEDMATVRKVLRDFVDTQMIDGDLVAIIRVVGGKGLLQQFTSDRQLLRRAIAQLNVATNPYSVTNTAQERFTSRPAPFGSAGPSEVEEDFADEGLQNFTDPNDETQRLFRGLMSLSTAGFVIDSLKEIPGRKSLVLISGGIPIFETANSGTAYSSVSQLLNRLTDQAVRAGVVINAMDPRGLKASPGVASFRDTPARSALSTSDPSFGRGGGADMTFGPPLAGAAEHLGLSTVANATGGVSVVNTNDFKKGLDKVLARSAGYYVLAYTPINKFDNKFRTLQVKVKRPDVKVYAHRGYVAREERTGAEPRTKEQEVMAAVQSPIAKRDLDVSANINMKPSLPRNTATLDIHIVVDAKTLTFSQTSDGKQQTSFDVVGFIYDQMGNARGGFSQTINTNLSPEKYREAIATGLTYTATTELPPGNFQVRAAVREVESGKVGTLSKYVEVPDLTKGRLAMSSVFLFATDPADPKSTPTPLLALRQISRKQDLRYAAQIVNAKRADSTQLKSQVIISQGSKILFREPEQPIAASADQVITKIGQIGLSKVSPGRYVLTLVVTDALADKKHQTVARSIDFVVVN